MVQAPRVYRSVSIKWLTRTCRLSGGKRIHGILKIFRAHNGSYVVRTGRRYLFSIDAPACFHQAAATATCRDAVVPASVMFTSSQYVERRHP